MAGIDYDGNRKYFREVSYKPSIILIAIAVFMFGTGDTDLTIVGLALAGTGAYLTRFRE